MRARLIVMGTLLRGLDARWFQILFLASFLLFGALVRDFALYTTQIVACFAAGLATQALWQWALRLPGRGSPGAFLSAIVTCCGICILVRAQNGWIHPLLACVAMSSKYLLRAGPANCKSHILNPANLGACVAVAGLGGSWLSPGQWGADSLTALWFLALGGLVTQRIARWDVSVAFLLAWATLLSARLFWLDYAWDPGAAIWLQQISNGSTLLFAFFMISDPMTTPQHRAVRLAYVVLVAAAAFYWQFVLFKPQGLIVALFAMSWAVPMLNMLWPRTRFAWDRPRARPTSGPLSAASGS